MAKMRTDIRLSVTFLKEGNQFVAYSPALDLSTCGKTFQEARRRFGEAALLFFEELHRKGVAEAVFRDLGWQKKESSFVPPVVIGQESQTIPVRT